MNGARVWIDHYEPEDYARIGDQIAGILLHGLAAPGSAWSPARLPQIEWPSADEVSPKPSCVRRRSSSTSRAIAARRSKISARLNVTKGSFYHHNDNKDDLIADCFARTFAVVRQVQRAAETTGQTGWDRLCTAADELVRYQLSEQGRSCGIRLSAPFPRLSGTR